MARLGRSSHTIILKKHTYEIERLNIHKRQTAEEESLKRREIYPITLNVNVLLATVSSVTSVNVWLGATMTSNSGRSAF